MEDTKKFIHEEISKKVSLLGPQWKKESLYENIKIFLSLMLFAGGINLLIFTDYSFWGLLMMVSAVFVVGIFMIIAPEFSINDKLILFTYKEFAEETLDDGTFIMNGFTPGEVFRNSNLFGRYIDIFGGYQFTGEINRHPVRISQLRPRSKTSDNYYEGVLISGEFFNPLRVDFYMKILPNVKDWENYKDHYYCGRRMRGFRLSAAVDLSHQIWEAGMDNTSGWGEVVYAGDDIMVYSMDRKSFRQKFKNSYGKQFQKLKFLFPGREIYLSCRGNSYYLFINYHSVLQYALPSELKDPEITGRMFDEYLKVYTAAELLVNLHRK